MCLNSVSKSYAKPISTTKWLKGFKVYGFLIENGDVKFVPGYSLPAVAGKPRAYSGVFDHEYKNDKPINNTSPVYPLGFHVLKTMKDVRAYKSNAKDITKLTSTQLVKYHLEGSTYENFIFPVLYRSVVATGNQSYFYGGNHSMCDIALEMKIPRPKNLAKDKIARLMGNIEIEKAKVEVSHKKKLVKLATNRHKLTLASQVIKTKRIKRDLAHDIQNAKRTFIRSMKWLKTEVADAAKTIIVQKRRLVDAEVKLRVARKARAAKSKKAK